MPVTNVSGIAAYLQSLITNINLNENDLNNVFGGRYEWPVRAKPGMEGKI